jgi:CIC family chloride channel protein
MRYAWFGVLGCVSGLVGTLLPEVLYGLRDAFRGLAFSVSVNPAIDGLGFGLLAWKFPQILSCGWVTRKTP